MNKIRMFLISATAIVGVTALGAGAIYAAQPQTGSNFMSSLVNAIATRFHLNPSDVQQVVDQQREQMQAQKQADFAQRFKTKLDQQVANGTITQDQENKILAKETEVQNFLTSLNGKSPSDRQAAIQSEITSLQQWAKDNNIPTNLFPFHLGGRGMMGFGGMMGNFGRRFGGHRGQWNMMNQNNNQQNSSSSGAGSSIQSPTTSTP
ncbi:MAG TPA: hypothetical protein VFQ60_04530 [Patescibacteria group bacterium]|nr:hypothetical protein [Patescibacteria group bacterium]